MRTSTRVFRVAPTFLALALLVSAAGLTARAQQNAAPLPSIDAQAVLPMDPAIRTGTLPNGLKYFIRRNDRPELRQVGAERGRRHQWGERRRLRS